MQRPALTTRAALFFLIVILLLVAPGGVALAAGPRERPDGLERALARLADRTTGDNKPADQAASDKSAAQAPAAAPSAAVPAPGRPYTVQAGDTLWDIASGHDLTVDALLAANHLDAQALLQPGQTLLLPGQDGEAGEAAPASAAAPSAPAPAKSAPDLLYTVQPGDTLWDIAATHDLTVAALVAANNLDEAALLQPGQTLRVPAGNVAPAPAAPAAEPAAGKPAQGYTYTIQANDTLWDIAASHGLTVDALLAANQLDAAGLLHPGQQLFVPASPLPARTKAAAPAAGPAPAVPQALAAWPATLLELINAQRTARGLAGLTWSNELAGAAQAHAADCERRGWGSHVGSDGARLAARLGRAGFAARYAGENWANTQGVNATFNMWWNEPPGADPHRQNILSPLYHEIGIGVADAGWGYYFIADFGSR